MRALFLTLWVPLLLVSALPAWGDEESPPAFSAEGPTALPPLKPGEVIQSESLHVDAGGHFAYLRTVRRSVGFLGADVKPLDREEAERLGASPFVGVLLTAVERGGPAATAGLVRDDIVDLYGGVAVRSVEQFAALVEETAPGTRMPVEVVRDGARVQLQVTVGSVSRVSSSRAVSRTLPVLDDRQRTGLVLAEVPADLAAHVPGAAGARGLLIASILPGGPAFFSAARRKDLLLEAAGRPVPTLLDYRSALSDRTVGAAIDLTLLRAGERVRSSVTLARDATRVRQVKIPLLLDLEQKAEKRKLRVLWGTLFQSRTSHYFEKSGQEPATSREVGAILGLVRYESTPEESEPRLLWIFPLRFGSHRES